MASENYTVQCINNYAGSCLIRKPPAGAVYAPWVRLKFFTKDNDLSVITVGNKSSPDNDNRACIKEFSYGQSDGITCRVTIMDEEGSNFIEFMKNLVKDLKCMVPNGYQMQIQFGWITDDCSGKTPGFYGNISPYYYLMPIDVVCDFQGGKFLFEITAVDVGKPMFEARVDKIYDNKRPINQPTIKQAIRELLTDVNYPPSVAQVDFLQIDDRNSAPKELEFKDKDGKDKSPKGQWVCNNIDKLSTCRKWIDDYTTTNSKGIAIMYDNTISGGRIIFYEDKRPGCGEIPDYDANCVGTYIVNGGKDSRVLNFTPKIRWNFMSAANAGGGMNEVGVLSKDGGKLPGREDCKGLNRNYVKTAGGQVAKPASENQVDRYGVNANDEVAKANAANMAAYRPFVLPIEAEMTIIGDPNLLPPIQSVGKNVHIVYINPFFIKKEKGKEDGGCADWIAKPSCNPVLSNKAWMINNISHKISDGVFTTHLGLFLATPGVDTDIDAPLGGPGSSGWQPPRNC